MLDRRTYYYYYYYLPLLLLLQYREMYDIPVCLFGASFIHSPR